jgi:hypothetical protein
LFSTQISLSIVQKDRKLCISNTDWLESIGRAGDITIDHQDQNVIIGERPVEATSSSDSSFTSDSSAQDAGVFYFNEHSNGGAHRATLQSKMEILDQRPVQQAMDISARREPAIPNVQQVQYGEANLVKDPLTELRRQHVQGQHYDVFDPSTSESGSHRPLSINETQPLPDEPLNPDVPSNSLLSKAIHTLSRASPFKHAATVPLEAKEFPKPDSSTRKRFSFQPGDDSILFSSPTSPDTSMFDPYDVQSTGVLRTEVGLEGLSNVQDDKSSGSVKPSLQTASRPSMLLLRKSKDDDPSMSRADSGSSVVTAVRHNSGHGSVSTQSSAGGGSPRRSLQGAGQNESKGSEKEIKLDTDKPAEVVAAASRTFNQGGSKAGLPMHLQPDLQEHRFSAKKKKAKDQKKSSSGKATPSKQD